MLNSVGVQKGDAWVDLDEALPESTRNVPRKNDRMHSIVCGKRSVGYDGNAGSRRQFSLLARRRIGHTIDHRSIEIVVVEKGIPLRGGAYANQSRTRGAQPVDSLQERVSRAHRLVHEANVSRRIEELRLAFRVEKAARHLRQVLSHSMP